ncbi:MAG: hypothetical protein RLZZ267_537 [Bacillota bacterium]|jgi:hypothetical protein
MKFIVTWTAFLMVFGFALFLGLDQGHQRVQSWAAKQQVAVATPTPTPTPVPVVTPVPVQPVIQGPTSLELMADATGVILQKGAQQGVEWTVAIFEQLLN